MRHSGISGVSKWVTRFAGLFLAAVPTWGAGPSLVFSKVFGGSAADTVAAIATDFQGNVVLAGLTTSADFPVTNGVGGAPPAVNQYDLETVFVALNGTGSAAVTSSYLSGLNSDTYYATSFPYPYIAVDTAGNAWLAGSLNQSAETFDFPVTTSAASGPNGAWLAEVSMSSAGNVIASPNSLNFGTNVPVDVSSTAYDLANSQTPTTIALRNMGSAPVTLSSVVANPSYFTETDNCNGAIAAASYCTATVAFTPPNDTPVTGTLTIASNGINSPAVVSLSGQGTDGGFLVASSSSLSFGNVTVNTTPM